MNEVIISYSNTHAWMRSQKLENILVIFITLASVKIFKHIMSITGTTEYSDEIHNNGNSEYCQYISFIEHQ